MNVGFNKNFKKQFDKLPKNIQEQFFNRLNVFLINSFTPILNNHQLRGKLKNMRSINVTGDIRAIYEQINKNKVLFLTIANHSKLYD